MSPGKKTKKQKGKTINLSSFLNENNTGGTYVQKSISWAQEVEDEQDGYMSSRAKEVLLPTAPRAAREPGIDEENIPTSPPYVAYLSNLPYEVDEDDIKEFFTDMKISGMRLPKDNNKLKGYGYVEFHDRQSLIDALSMTNTNIKGRRVRIEISNSSNEERRGQGNRGRDNRRDNYDNPERTSGDWRSGPRDESLRDDGDSYRSRYDNRRDERPASDYDNKPGAWRDRENNDGGRSTMKSFRDDDRDRDWHHDRGSRDRDGDRDRGSSFGPRRNYDDRRELDWGRDGSRRDNRTGGGGMDSRSEPRTRPKLNLHPRTKPVEPVKVEAEPEEAKPAAAPAAAPAANIFGAAKPVDTAAREREIEERLAKAAEAKSRDEGDADKRSTKDWGRRNGEGRDDKEKSRPTWRSEEDRSQPTERPTVRSQQSGRSDQRGDSRGPPPTRSGPPPAKGPVKPTEARGPSEREKEKDEVSKMPKAKDEQAPNFVASNKYSMLPDDVDPDNLDD